MSNGEGMTEPVFTWELTSSEVNALAGFLADVGAGKKARVEMMPDGVWYFFAEIDV